LKIGSLESEKIIIGSLELEKIGSVESEKSGPYRSILSYLTFSSKRTCYSIHILAKLHCHHDQGLILMGRFRSRSGLQNNSENMLKLI